MFFSSTNQGTNNVEGLILDMSASTTTHLTAKTFERFPNLRLLEIIGAHDITGNFKNSFYQLRCIRWSYCPWTLLPSSFCPQKLVSLNVPFSKLKALWTDIKVYTQSNLNTLLVDYRIKVLLYIYFFNLISFSSEL